MTRIPVVEQDSQPINSPRVRDRMLSRSFHVSYSAKGARSCAVFEFPQSEMVVLEPVGST